MTSDYNDIFGRFYQHAEDYKIVGLDQTIVDSLLAGYIKAVIAEPLVRRLFTDITIDEDVGEIEYTMRESIDDNFDQNFVEELVSRGMVVQWLAPQYYSMKNSLQFITNSDQRFFSQANHMTELKGMLNKAYVDFRKYMRDKGYSSALINGVT